MKCRKDCYKCGKASFRADSKGYPFGIECLKTGEYIELRDAREEKVFDYLPDESLESK